MKEQFRDLAVDMVQKTFATLSEMATVRRETGSSFDEDTGEVRLVVTTTQVPGIFSNYTARQDDLRAVPSATMVGYIPAKMLPEIGENDSITLDNRAHVVVRADLDAANAMHVVYLRRQ